MVWMPGHESSRKRPSERGAKAICDYQPKMAITMDQLAALAGCPDFLVRLTKPKPQKGGGLPVARRAQRLICGIPQNLCVMQPHSPTSMNHQKHLRCLSF